MNKPYSKTEQDIAWRVERSNINTNLAQRWENGTSHHPKSENLARQIGAIDWLYNDNALDFRFGGDGDNGEQLIYILDILFELQDAEGNSND